MNHKLTLDDCKDLGKYVLLSYVSYKSLQFIWWKLRNQKTRAKGKSALEERNRKSYHFKDVPKEIE